MKHFRVAALVPRVNVADCSYNTAEIIGMMDDAAFKGVALGVFPEMSVTAYTCGDLFHNDTLLDGACKALAQIVKASERHSAVWVVGMPLVLCGAVYNCAVFVQSGRVAGAVPKCFVPNYNEFYEERWWASGIGVDTTIKLPGVNEFTLSYRLLFETPDGVRIAAEICEDLWAPVPPSTYAAMAGADIIVNLSASNDLTGKYEYLLDLIRQQSARCMSAYVYSSAGYGESSTDLVFDGKAIIAENGSLLEASERWQRDPHCVIADIDIESLRHDRVHHNTFNDCRKAAGRESDSYSVVKLSSVPSIGDGETLLHYYTPTPFIPADTADVGRRASEIINIQCAGLARRLQCTRTRSAVIGISGGLDSTLALLVTVKTFDMLGLDRKGVVGVTMPGFGTTDRTYNNALTMMSALGITIREIPIAPAVEQHFKDIGHDKTVHDVTYENSQARERTQILMDVANQTGGMVIGTGDLSELALGWATYNGDHMSMYSVNCSVPKTLVKYLVKWFASKSTDEQERKALLDVVDTPISPELIPANPDGQIKQITEDLVGPYELHDFFLYHMIRFGRSPRSIYRLARQAFSGSYPDDIILKWLKEFFRRFFQQQFKRSCLPDGPKVGSICLSPRGDWRMPSDASAALWMAEIEELKS
ncbi:MAG: NAD(+) synthase [Muribaculaceae bacterium]|nr:NAD(+) synthase [Muribaculaceae bacterium]